MLPAGGNSSESSQGEFIEPVNCLHQEKTQYHMNTSFDLKGFKKEMDLMGST